MKKILVIGIVSLLLSPFQAWALSLNIDTVLYENDGGMIDATLLSGSADLTVTEGPAGSANIQIILTNTTVSGAHDGTSSSRWLTGIGFDLPDTIDILAGSTVLGAGSTLYDNSGSPIAGGGADVSGDWGYLNGISGHYNDFSTETDTQISTMVADTGDNAFNDSLRETYDGLATLDGPPMGLVSTAFESDLSGGYSIVDSLMISVLINGLDGYSAAELESFIQASEVVLTFGSPDAKPVPEPSTIVLLGSGLLGLAYLRRRKN